MRSILVVALLLLAIPPPSQSSSDSSDDAAAISLVILQAQLQLDANGGQLKLQWVVTSDESVFGDGVAVVRPSLFVSCPYIHWDGAALHGPDSYPNSHCGLMFATMLPFPAALLTPGVHTLRIFLADPPASSRMLCPALSCSDSVTFDLRSPAASDNFHLDGGIPMIFHRIWFSPPAQLQQRPIPSTYQRYWQSWRRLHEARGWKFVTWTAPNLEKYTAAMLRDERFNGRGHIATASASLTADDGQDGSVSVMNAVDILRLLVVADVGGVYIDTDYEALQEIDSHIMHSSAFVSEEEEGVIHSALFGAAPGHVLISKSYDLAMTNLLNPKLLLAAANMKTGPAVFNTAYQVLIGGWYADLRDSEEPKVANEAGACTDGTCDIRQHITAMMSSVAVLSKEIVTPYSWRDSAAPPPSYSPHVLAVHHWAVCDGGADRSRVMDGGVVRTPHWGCHTHESVAADKLRREGAHGSDD